MLVIVFRHLHWTDMYFKYPLNNLKSVVLNANLQYFDNRLSWAAALFLSNLWLYFLQISTESPSSLTISLMWLLLFCSSSHKYICFNWEPRISDVQSVFICILIWNSWLLLKAKRITSRYLFEMPCISDSYLRVPPTQNAMVWYVIIIKIRCAWYFWAILYILAKFNEHSQIQGNILFLSSW